MTRKTTTVLFRGNSECDSNREERGGGRIRKRRTDYFCSLPPPAVAQEAQILAGLVSCSFFGDRKDVEKVKKNRMEEKKNPCPDHLLFVFFSHEFSCVWEKQVSAAVVIIIHPKHTFDFPQRHISKKITLACTTSRIHSCLLWPLPTIPPFSVNGIWGDIEGEIRRKKAPF